MLKSLSLPIVLALSLTGCKTASVKPSPQPTAPVECRRQTTADVPQAPIESIEAWVAKGPAWAVAVLELLTEERALRKLEHECYGKEMNK